MHYCYMSIKTLISGAEYPAAQLAECLPAVNEALGSTHSTTEYWARWHKSVVLALRRQTGGSQVQDHLSYTVNFRSSLTTEACHKKLNK